MKSAIINISKAFVYCLMTLAIFGGGLEEATAQNPLGNTVVEILPVSVNTGAGVINGDTVNLPSGGVIVELEILVSNWGATGDGLLQSIQTSIDGNSYCSGLGDSLYPLGYPGAPIPTGDQPAPGPLTCPFGQGFCQSGVNNGLACQTNNDCPSGNCMFGCAGTGTVCEDGGFSVQKRCTENQTITGLGAACGSGFPVCPAGEFCVDNPDHVFTGFNPLSPIAYPGLSYQFSSVSQAGGKADATCVGGNLDGMPCGPTNNCLTGTCTGPPVKAYIGTLLLVVPPGASGTYTIDILFDTEITFSSDGRALSFAIQAANIHPAFIVIPCLVGPGCEDCNPCTDDSVNPDLTCSNVPNFVVGEECCDPSSRTISIMDDGNDCTQDLCNATTGNVTHNPVSNGTPCGGLPTGPCDAQNTCTIAGLCFQRSAFFGVPCGDPSTTACSNSDSCNGFGFCSNNNLPNGAACSDGLFCTISDTCTFGVCTGNARSCDDTIPCTTDSCDEGLSSCINDEASCLCTTILASTPTECTVDARIPHEGAQSSSLLGWDSIDLDFNVGCSCDSISVGDLSVSDVPGSLSSDVVAGQAVITGITGGVGNLCTVDFAGPIPANQWTCVGLKINGVQRCIGALPVDVDADLFSMLVDIATLTAHLDLSTGQLNETDINRDGIATTLDVVEAINLLIGADQFDPWLDANINQICP